MEELKSPKAARCTFVTDNQTEQLIQFMKEHQNLREGLFSLTFTKEIDQKLWQELSEILNKSNGGAIKTPKQWKKTWQDLRKNAISKNSKIKRAMNMTGGGEPPEEKLKPFDVNILELVAPAVVSGHEGIDESEVTFELNRYNGHFLKAPSDTPALEKASCSYQEEAMDTATQVKSTPLSDHNYGVKKITGLKRKRKSAVSTKIKRLTSSQELSARVIEMSEVQEKEKAMYRKEKLKLMREKI